MRRSSRWLLNLPALAVAVAAVGCACLLAISQHRRLEAHPSLGHWHWFFIAHDGRAVCGRLPWLLSPEGTSVLQRGPTARPERRITSREQRAIATRLRLGQLQATYRLQAILEGNGHSLAHASATLAAAAAILAALAAWLRRYVARRQAGRCPSCSYDLTGNVSGACPECGTAVVKGNA